MVYQDNDWCYRPQHWQQNVLVWGTFAVGVLIGNCNGRKDAWMHVGIAGVTALVHCSRDETCHGWAAIRTIRDTIRFRSAKHSRYDVLGLTRNPAEIRAILARDALRDIHTMLAPVRMFVAKKNPVEFARMYERHPIEANRTCRNDLYERKHNLKFFRPPAWHCYEDANIILYFGKEFFFIWLDLWDKIFRKSKYVAGRCSLAFESAVIWSTFTYIYVISSVTMLLYWKIFAIRPQKRN